MDDLEKKFAETVERHGAEIQAAYDKLIELSEKYGIPVCTYVPRSFHPFRGYETSDYNWIDGVSCDTIAQLPFTDTDYWQSSTTECEFR